MTAYPPVDLSRGDLKKSPLDPYSVFGQACCKGKKNHYLNYGIEICLDHNDARLLQNQKKTRGQNKSNVIHVQLIPSSGMQIKPQSVAAGTNGFVFNCDGQFSLGSKQGKARAGRLDGVECVYAGFIKPKQTKYAAHTQLVKVKKAAKRSVAKFHRMSSDDVYVHPVLIRKSLKLKRYFSGGAGQVHIYGQNHGYTVYPGQF